MRRERLRTVTGDVSVKVPVSGTSFRCGNSTKRSWTLSYCIRSASVWYTAMFKGGRDCPPFGEKERLPRVDREAYGRPTKAVDRRRRLILSAIDVNACEIYCFTGLARSSAPLAYPSTLRAPFFLFLLFLSLSTPLFSFSPSTSLSTPRSHRRTLRHETKE